MNSLELQLVAILPRKIFRQLKDHIGAFNKSNVSWFPAAVHPFAVDCSLSLFFGGNNLITLKYSAFNFTIHCNQLQASLHLQILLDYPDTSS